jgi:uncharacterized protein YdaU (DUF1376 family)
MKNPPPAFQFYARDFLAEMLPFSNVEVGAVIRLRAYAWLTGSLPGDDVIALARVMCCDVAEAEVIWSRIHTFFTRCKNGLWRCRVLDAERRKQREHRKQQSLKGKAGAAARWQAPSSGHSNGHASAMAQASPNDGSSSSSSSSSSNQVLHPKDPGGGVCVVEPDTPAHTHRPRGTSNAHRHCDPQFCAAIDPAVPCLNNDHVEELANRCLGYPRDRVLAEFSAFAREAVTRFPGIYEANVFKFGRQLWDAWMSDRASRQTALERRETLKAVRS